MATKTLRELVVITSSKDRIGLCFADTGEKANVVQLGGTETIVWPSVYSPNSIEDNAPPKADAFRFRGEPYRTLDMARNTEKVKIQYYRIND